MKNRKHLPPIANWTLLLLALLTVGPIAAVQAQSASDPDLPGAQASFETIPAGSLVIPMDNNLQALNGTPFNLKAYGLLNALLHRNIPVKWAIAAGKAKDGSPLDLNSVFEAVGKRAAGQIGDAELHDVECRACPSGGSCSGMFTANSMNVLCEAMGVALPGNGTILALTPEREALVRRAARRAVEIAADERFRLRNLVTGSDGQASITAMVSSPTTMANVRNTPLSSAARRLGRIMRMRMVNQPAPRLCAASVRLRTSIACSASSTASRTYTSHCRSNSFRSRASCMPSGVPMSQPSNSRQAVDPWQAAAPLAVNGGTYNTQGLYDVALALPHVRLALGDGGDRPDQSTIRNREINAGRAR